MAMHLEPRGYEGILTCKSDNLPLMHMEPSLDTIKFNMDLANSEPCSPRSQQTASPDPSFVDSDAENDSTTTTSGKRKRGPAVKRPLTPAMTRRNARERNRVRFLNTTFDVLRQHLPGKGSKSKSKKLSKVDTLREAIYYIQDLSELLENSAAVDAAMRTCPDPSRTLLEPCQEPSSQALLEPQLLSPGGSLSSATSTSSASPKPCSDGTLTSDEEDLLDMSNWLQYC